MRRLMRLLVLLVRSVLKSRFSAEIVVVAVIVVLALSLLGPSVLLQREQARQRQTISQLKDIGLSMHSYHDTHQTFPANAATRLQPDGVKAKRHSAVRKIEPPQELLISPY